MIISKIEIHNFRNLEDFLIDFDSNINYLIGDNNLGKSNLLDLLTIVSEGKSFEEKDYFNYSKAIEIKITLKETVILESKTENENFFTYSYKQGIKDIYPKIYNISKNKEISIKDIQKIIFINYKANELVNKNQRNDKLSINDDFFKHVISRSESRDQKVINNSTAQKLKSFLFLNNPKAKSLHGFDFKYYSFSRPSEFFLKLKKEESWKEDYLKSVKYFAFAVDDIINKIFELYKSYKNPLEKLIIRVEDKKYLPLILALDNPEIQFHPYMQRSLINHYKKIMNNEDEEFLELLKFCFDIDGIIGQLIISTHSSAAILDNYKNLIRFYKDDNKTKVVCGSQIKFNDNSQKHLSVHFPNIKEAFYAKCVLIFEGETEYGCLPYFAKTLKIKLDELAISLINARGEGSIPKIQQLFKSFKIPTVAIYDLDSKKKLEKKYLESENVFFTNSICFELEIIDNLIKNNAPKILEEIAKTHDEEMFYSTLNNYFISKGFHKLNIDFKKYKKTSLSKLSLNNLENFKIIYFAWFYRQKGYLLGRVIGKKIVDGDLIPNSYKEALLLSQKIAIGK